MTYRIAYAPSVEKDLKVIPTPDQISIIKRIERLAEDPRPAGMEHLKGKLQGLNRVRVGNYRIVYRVEPGVVRVIKVDKRGRIYKRL